MYISIGSQRSDEDGSNSFLKSNSRIFKELTNFISGTVQYSIHLDYAALFVDSTNYSDPVADEVCLRIAFVYLCADVFWLELLSEGDLEDTQSSSQSTLSNPLTTTETGFRKKKIKLEDPKSIILDFLKSQSSKTLVQATTVQILNLVVVRRPDMAEFLISAFGLAVFDLLSAHEDNVSHFACLTLSNFLKCCQGKDLAQFSFDKMWNLTIALLGSKSSCLPFSLLDILIAQEHVKTAQMIDCMKIFTSLSAWLVSTETLSCLRSLFSFANLWDKDVITSLFTRFLKLAAYLAKQLDFASYRLMFGFFNVLIYDDIIPHSCPESNNYIEQDALIFNRQFNQLESRLSLSSGFNGNLIAKKYLGLVATNPSKHLLNTVRLNLLLLKTEEFLRGFGSSPSNEKDVCEALGSLVLIAGIIDSTAAQCSSILMEKLEKFGEITVLNSNALSKDQIGKLLLPIQQVKTKRILAPLSEKLTLNLYEIWERSKKSSAAVFEDGDASETLFELSSFGEKLQKSSVIQLNIYLNVSLLFARQDGLFWSAHFNIYIFARYASETKWTS